MDDLDGITVPEVDTARVEDMVKEYFSQANDVSPVEEFHLAELNSFHVTVTYIEKLCKDAFNCSFLRFINVMKSI